MAEAQKRQGALQKQFQKDVEDEVIAPLTEYMKSAFGRLKRGKATVEQRRKEMDGALNKAKHDDGETQEKVQLATAAYKAQLATVQDILNRLPHTYRKQSEVMKTFVKLQEEHYNECKDVATTFLGRMK